MRNQLPTRENERKGREIARLISGGGGGGGKGGGGGGGGGGG